MDIVVFLQRAFAHYADLDPRPGGGAEVPYARLLAFCKAFNLLPSLLSLTQAYVNFRASRTADEGGGDKDDGKDAEDDGDEDSRHEHSLTYPEFVEFVGRCALCAFAAPYLAKQHPTPEAKVAALFAWLHSSQARERRSTYRRLIDRA